MERNCRSKAATALDKGAHEASASGVGGNPGRGIVSIPFLKNKSEMLEASNIERCLMFEG